MNNSIPLVSILMTVHNGMPYLKKSVPSLLTQSYCNIELVVVDDQSSDDSLTYLKSISDPRLIIISEGKLGRGKALNRGLRICKGKYIAINDADDVSLVDRIEKQVQFLEENEEYGLVGSSFIKDFGKKEEKVDKPSDNMVLRQGLSTHSCLQHSTVMFRKEILDLIGGYNLDIKFMYDRDIYIRAAKISKITNLREYLVIINRHQNQFFVKNHKGFERYKYRMYYCWLATHKLKLPKYQMPLKMLKLTYGYLKSLMK